MSHSIIIGGKRLCTGAPGTLDSLFRSLTDPDQLQVARSSALARLELRYRTSIKDRAILKSGFTIALMDGEKTLREAKIAPHGDLLRFETAVTTEHGMEDIPENWLIFTSTRPLLGHRTMENASFLRGRFRAAVDPSDAMAERYIAENGKLAASVVVSGTREELVSMALMESRYRDEYLKQYQGDDRWDVLQSKINDLSTLELGEVLWRRQQLQTQQRGLLQMVRAALGGEEALPQVPPEPEITEPELTLEAEASASVEDNSAAEVEQPEATAHDGAAGAPASLPIPQDSWRDNLIKARVYARELMLKGILAKDDAAPEVWTDKDRLVALIDSAVAALLPASDMSTTKGRAEAGGEVGVNGYFYKGGQFLPSTDAEPGRWRIGKKWVSSTRELVAPGELKMQPTPFSRSIFAMIRDWCIIDDAGQLSLRQGIWDNTGDPITLETMTRPGVKGVQGEEEISLGDLIEAYNKGMRWFDVDPDALTLTTQGTEPELAKNALKPAEEEDALEEVAPEQAVAQSLNALALIDVHAPEHKGQWEFQGYEERKRPEHYVDGQGNDRTRMVGDLDLAEVSAGSGQRIVNIYWLKHKQTGEVRSFGADTAHIAMGLRDAASAQRRAQRYLSEQEAQQRNDEDMARRAQAQGKPTLQEAADDYLKRNKAEMSFERRNGLIRDLMAFEKDGLFFVLPGAYADTMGRIGWQALPLPAQMDVVRFTPHHDENLVEPVQGIITSVDVTSTGEQRVMILPEGLPLEGASVLRVVPRDGVLQKLGTFSPEGRIAWMPGSEPEIAPEPDAARNVEASSELEKIPLAVRSQIMVALRTLKDAEFGLSGAERARGLNSEAVAVVVEQLRPEVERAQNTLNRVREVAVGKGVAFDAVMAELGEIPDLSRFGLALDVEDTAAAAAPAPAAPIEPAERMDVVRFIPREGDRLIDLVTGTVRSVERTSAGDYRVRIVYLGEPLSGNDAVRVVPRDGTLEKIGTHNLDGSISWLPGHDPEAGASSSRRFERMIQAAANNIEQLQESDVHHVLVQAQSPESLAALGRYIVDRRADLADGVDEASAEIRRNNNWVMAGGAGELTFEFPGLVDESQRALLEAWHAAGADPATRPAERAVYLPDLSVAKMEALITKQALTADDIEALKDYKYLLLAMPTAAAEKGFLAPVATDGGSHLAPINQFWLTNIENALERAGITAPLIAAEHEAITAPWADYAFVVDALSEYGPAPASQEAIRTAEQGIEGTVVLETVIRPSGASFHTLYLSMGAGQYASHPIGATLPVSIEGVVQEMRERFQRREQDRAVAAQQEVQRQQSIAAANQLVEGRKIGQIILNTGKMLRAVVIRKDYGNGTFDVQGVAGARAAVVRGIDAESVVRAMERASQQQDTALGDRAEDDIEAPSLFAAPDQPGQAQAVEPERQEEWRTSLLKARKKATELGLPTKNRSLETLVAAIERNLNPATMKEGMALSEGDVVLTVTGRRTTPFPAIATDSNRAANKTVKAVAQWLMQNALDEAEARGDDYNARMFRSALDNPQQADRDSAELYLTDPASIHPAQRPFLKPLAPSQGIAEQSAGATLEQRPMQDQDDPLFALMEGPNAAEQADPLFALMEEPSIDGQPAGAIPTPDDDDTSELVLARMVLVSADNIEVLRRIDVYRVMAQAKTADQLAALGAYIAGKREDLAGEVRDVALEIGAERDWQLLDDALAPKKAEEATDDPEYVNQVRENGQVERVPPVAVEHRRIAALLLSGSADNLPVDDQLALYDQLEKAALQLRQLGWSDDQIGANAYNKVVASYQECVKEGLITGLFALPPGTIQKDVAEKVIDNQGRDLEAVKRHQEFLYKKRQEGSKRSAEAFAKKVARVPLAEWTEVKGVKVLRSGQSKYAAVPHNGKETAANFDIIDLEAGELVLQLKSREVRSWLWRTAQVEAEEADASTGQAELGRDTEAQEAALDGSLPVQSAPAVQAGISDALSQQEEAGADDEVIRHRLDAGEDPFAVLMGASEVVAEQADRRERFGGEVVEEREAGAQSRESVNDVVTMIARANERYLDWDRERKASAARYATLREGEHIEPEAEFLPQSFSLTKAAEYVEVAWPDAIRKFGKAGLKRALEEGAESNALNYTGQKKLKGLEYKSEAAPSGIGRRDMAYRTFSRESVDALIAKLLLAPAATERGGQHHASILMRGSVLTVELEQPLLETPLFALENAVRNQGLAGYNEGSLNAFRREHEKVVAEIYRKGGSISDSVLADYPSLVRADLNANPQANEVTDKPFNLDAWDKEWSDRIKASKDAGNKHLDDLPRYVETMRGKSVYYVHDHKITGVVRTVDSRGNVYINWSDEYSAEKEMASPVRDGNKTVMQTSIGLSDLKDYVVGNPPATVPTPGQQVILGKGRQEGSVVEVAPDAVKMRLGNRIEKMSRETFARRSAAAKRESKVDDNRQANPPLFETYADANEWIDQRAKALGMSRRAFGSTDEYKRVYPQIEALYAAEKSVSAEQRQKLLADAGVSAGDEVATTVYTAFGGADTYTGKVFLKGGIPYVRVDGRMTVSKNGRLREMSEVKWDGRWTKSAVAPSSATTQPAPAPIEQPAAALPKNCTELTEEARCLVPESTGLWYEPLSEEDPWLRFFTNAPRPRTPFEQKYSDRQIRSRR